MTPTFGTGGNSESFYSEGHKSTAEAPAWLRGRGLDAYEYQAGHGLTSGEASLRKVGEAAKQYGILMSLHSPYFISLSSVELEKRLNSIGYIKKSLAAAEYLGADLIVVHTGSAGKISRAEAMELASDTLYKLLEDVGDTGIKIGLETMGKLNQLGTLDEVLTLCKLDKRLYPVVDFGHLNCRGRFEAGVFDDVTAPTPTGGVFVSTDDYRTVFDKIANRLGDDYARGLHCHFSKIEYTAKGEKKHVRFVDEGFEPPFEPLMEAIAREGLAPRIISESAGTMAEDAKAMKDYYFNILEKK
ncbi:MAG: TIM barrel protein [Clostridiales bacterium]|nr:TIM barrel protein [Clostridiales bacterium]